MGGQHTILEIGEQLHITPIAMKIIFQIKKIKNKSCQTI